MPRFLKRVERADNGCWLWTGGNNGRGYGQFSVNGVKVYTHRWAYEHFIGPIPEGTELDHLCKTPACCNPRHLEPVSHRENGLRAGPDRHLAVCLRGHPRDARGICRDCDRDRRARLRAEWRRRVAAGDPTVPHGRISTFSSWGCRCTDCVDAYRAYRRTRTA